MLMIALVLLSAGILALTPAALALLCPYGSYNPVRGWSDRQVRWLAFWTGLAFMLLVAVLRETLGYGRAALPSPAELLALGLQDMRGWGMLLGIIAGGAVLAARRPASQIVPVLAWGFAVLYTVLLCVAWDLFLWLMAFPGGIALLIALTLRTSREERRAVTAVPA